MGFLVDKVALGRIFSAHFCFPCQFSFHRLPILILHRTLYSLDNDSGVK
jgi:hypothetical protein